MLPVILPTASRAVTALALTPSQRKAAKGVLRGLERGGFAVLQDQGNRGKTTVLEHVQQETGAAMVGVREFLSSLAAHRPEAIEEAFLDLVEAEIESHEIVLVDDFHLVKNIADDYDYPRKFLLDAVVTSLLTTAASKGKRLLFAANEVPVALSRRAHTSAIAEFTAKDYKVVCSAYLGVETSARLNFGEIHRFAPGLSAHHLRKAAVWLSHERDLSTSRFCKYLSRTELVSNVEEKKVEAVTWDDLKGMGDIVRELEAKVALPFERQDLADELKLRPKRGVLLAGPPGTGKTTIGRALAHRLKGKFFLIDGTLIAGSGRFYDEIDQVFSAAETNAPSVVFIDDADVIFGGDKESGLYRYLLTKLDGLESLGAGRICVMMTAMEPSDLPAAVLRSGRVELWLETRLPDIGARTEIFLGKLASLPPPLSNVDVAVLASASHGCTGADVKTIVEDGKLQFAHDQATGAPIRPIEEYFLDAIAAVRANRRKYRNRKPTHLTEPQTFGFRTK